VTATLTQETATEATPVRTDERSRSSAQLESSKGDLASRLYFVVSGVFFLGACLAGFVWAASVMSPGVVSLAEANAKLAPHGNLLPVAWNIAVYGWLSSAAFGAILYIVPRLTGTPLRFGEILALNALAWAGLVGVGALTVAAGFGRPLWLLEYPAPLHLAMAASSLVVLVSVMLSILTRVEQRLYPSLWYFVAALMWLPAALTLGSLPIYAGIGQAIQGAFVAQYVLGLWLFVVGTGVAYYVLPKETGCPLYSRRLAQLSLWGFAIFWGLAGGARLVFSPASGAYQSVSIAFAISATVPLLATVANVTKSLKGTWPQVATSPVVRWMTTGVVLLLLYTVLLPISVLRSVNQITGLTGAGYGIERVLLFGVVGSWLFGCAYFALPRITGRLWGYPRVIDWQLGLFVAGLLTVAIAEIVGGAVQGFLANSGAAQAFPVSSGKAWETIAGPQRWFAGMATLGWAAMAVSAVSALSNGIKTLIGGEPGFVETVSLPEEAASVRPQAEVVPEEARRRLVEPVMLPLASAATVVVVVYSASRILLAVQRYGSKAHATAVALAMAGVVLGVASLLAAGRRLSSGVAAGVLIVGVLAVVGGGAFAQWRLKAAEEVASGETAAGTSVTVSLTAQNIAFDKSSLEVPAGAAVSLAFENKDPLEHNFSVYRDEQMKNPVFQGSLQGQGSITYSFVAPSEQGTYYFFCDVHPTMKGIFRVA